MRARIAVLCALVPAVAYADVERVAPVGAPALPKAGETVLVWTDAAFVVDPAKPGERSKWSSLAQGREHAIGSAAPMRVVGIRRGELVEVTPIADGGCGNATVSSDMLEQLRVFVRRADLAPVIVTPVQARFDNGTSIELDVGLPVVMTKTTHVVVVEVAGEELPVDVPASHVGYAVAKLPAAVAAVEHPVGTQLYRMHSRATATVGAHPFTTRHGLFTPVATAVTVKGGATLFPFASRCARVVASVPSKQVESYVVKPAKDGARSAGMLGILSGAGDAEVLPKGTPMFVGKHRVGVLRYEVAVAQGSKCVQSALLTIDDARAKPVAAAVKICAPPATRLVKRKGLDASKLFDDQP